MRAPIAVACRSQYPEINLHLVTANDIFSLSRRDADIALRASTRPPEDLVGKRLGTMAHAVYGAKRYVQRGRNLQNLPDHAWIAFDDSMSGQVTLTWLSKIIPPEQAVVRTNTLIGVQRACADGLGLAVLPCFLGDSDSSLARVTGVLPDCKNELWILIHPDLRDTVRFKAVYQVIQAQVAKDASLLAGEAV